MPLRIRRLGYALGAEITGVDLRSGVDEPTFAAIKAAWLEHLLLCFPDQKIGKAELLAFAQRFGGELEDHSSAKTGDPENRNILLLSSKPAPGEKWDGYKLGLHWHSDKSFTDRPVTGTFLLAKEVPDFGGDTVFANQHLAYETLSGALRRIVDRLQGIHSQENLSQANLQVPSELLAAYRAIGAFRPAVHPVAKVHPETGRTALYIGERVRRFVGMTEDESRPFCTYLNRHAIRYEFQYRHRWEVNDLIVWDNRSLMHYAPLDYDPQTQPRVMLRCSLLGEVCGRYYTPELETDGESSSEPVTAGNHGG